MNELHDENQMADIPSPPTDSLDRGLAAAFGRPAEGPSSVLAELRPSLGPFRSVLLRDAPGDSDHVVRPRSDAMPTPAQAGDRYQLVGEIARGGMGAVLRGRDVDLGRDLAIKVLLAKYADKPEVARRFLEEAQIGGQLQHPGVVPVYNVGRFGDRPFFTMKLIKGQTLAALLSARETPVADAPGSPKDQPRLLGIALDVAQTLAYAHAKGVIHRDLKPSNVMVGAFGEVQVMDWGLAKVLAEGGVADEEQASRQHGQREDVTTIRTARSSGSAGSFGTATEAGSLLGTPAYMPPEQANGDVANLDRRADVFGLGAILCEILTGKPPYVGRSTEEVRRMSANGDLTDARARLDGCGSDAELIALTVACLSPEALDRPKDAQAVADSLSAYLDGVQTRLHRAEVAAAAATARAAEEAKRRRLTVALAATVLLAVTLGGGGWLWVKTDHDARQAQVTRNVNEALNRATALREQAKAATIGGAALFAQARELAQRALALVQSGPADAALKDRVQRLQTELDEEEKDRTLLAALDAAQLAQAETLVDKNRFATERAVPLFREAFQAYGLPAGAGEPAAAAERIRGRPAAVREAVIAALDQWISLAADLKLQITEPHLDWLRAVVEAAEPADGWTRQFRTARAEKDKAKRREALEKLAEATDVVNVPARALTRLAWTLDPAPQVALLRRAQARYPADFWVNHNLGCALQEVTPPEREEAVRFLTAAVALRPDSSGCLFNLGNALWKNGQVDEAIACYKKAIELDPKFAAAYFGQGNALRDQDQVDEAIVCYRKAIELDSKNAKVYNNLGVILSDVKRDYDGAIDCFRTAIALDPNHAKAHHSLGVILSNVKRDYDGAIDCFRTAIALDPNQANQATAHHNLGITLAHKDLVDDAIASYKKAIELDPKNAKVHSQLGDLLKGKGQFDEAIVYYKKAIELDSSNAAAHNNLGVILCDVKRDYDGAIACFRKAIELDATRANHHFNLGNALGFTGDVDEAIACYKDAIRLDPKNAGYHYNLGNALRRNGQLDEAIACFRQAIELDPTQDSDRSNLARAERMAAVQDKLAAFRKGEYRPTTNDERVGLADLCNINKLHRTAAGLYTDAFAADPKLANDLNAWHRYNAACSAARAAAGQGEEAAELDDQERSRLRQQALDWLRADLAAWTERLEDDPSTVRAIVQQKLRHWQRDSDLASIRDPAALAKLPEKERAAFAQLWSDVAALLKKAEDKQQ